MKLKQVKISILLPVYNGGQFIEPLLVSVISQTWHNFELLIYDDGSLDNSWDVITKFSKRDGRLRPQRSQVNRGQEHALLQLFDQCDSPLMMFCDQDDVWELEKISKLADALGDHAMAYGPSRLIDAAGTSLGRTLFDAVGLPIEGFNCLELLFRNTASAHAMLVKRNIVNRSAFAPSKANVLFDWRLAAAASYTKGLKYEPEAGTWHRIHGANRNNNRALANAPKLRKTHQQQLDRVNDLAEFLSQQPLIEQDKRDAFSALSTCLLYYRTRAKWHVTDANLRAEASRVVMQLDADGSSLCNFNRKIARIARGWLHPSFWWGELRARVGF